MMDASKRKATASGTDAKKESKADESDFLSLPMFLCFYGNSDFAITLSVHLVGGLKFLFPHALSLHFLLIYFSISKKVSHLIII